MATELLESAPIDSIVLTEKEAAAALKLSVKTLFNLRRAGALPYVRIGSRICYTRADLERFVTSRRRGGTK